ncbi:Tyrosine--tRNA ligase [Candidatus Rubidus massiliensis]|nr:Tyrosine--tRNA ligase [Candidatus Rubidus massiliensis]
MQNVIDVLKERGLIETLSAEKEMVDLLKKPTKIYCGFDPTSDSLHVGNLVAIMGLAWFEKFGHQPVAIVGGATGMIGDPSGKLSERQLLNAETIETNLAGIKKNLAAILKNPILLNNLDWFKEFSFISFLREVGKHFRLGPMLAKESVKLRLNSEEGMSFTEFSYQLLQGYDFLHLYQNFGVQMEIGGSDQWGNITAGIELVRKVLGVPVYGMTFPLLTKSDGQKFGKSEKGAVWLSADKLSPYEFYQYFIRVSDADVIKLMKMLTFMDLSEICTIERQMKESDYIPNTAQKRLAHVMTELVHGENNLQLALKVTQGIAPGAITQLDSQTLQALSKDLGSCQLSYKEVVNHKILDLLVKSGLQPSKTQARKSMTSGGIYLNNEKITDEEAVLLDKHLIDGNMLLLSFGKKNKIVVQLND